MTSSQPILGYWDIRGLAQPIRHLLVYVGADFIDKRYTYPNRVEWDQTDKFNLGLDFPNLPYLIDGPNKLTQSLAIMRYLGRKYNLNGTSDLERTTLSLLEQQIVDLYRNITRINYSPNADKLKDEFIATLPGQLGPLSAKLGDAPFAAGSDISYVDFLLYEYLKKVDAHVPGSLVAYPNLGKFLSRFESLPKLSAYIRASKPVPFNGPSAKWNVTL